MPRRAVAGLSAQRRAAARISLPIDTGFPVNPDQFITRAELHIY
jgi:hypothetical protein